MNRTQLLPRVVSREYFDSTGVANVDIEPERFGYVTHLGHDVYSFLTYTDDDGYIRNIHDDHLETLGLGVDEARSVALQNLPERVRADGLQETLIEAESGNDWAIWIGGPFTSSCVLSKDLYVWSKSRLKRDTFLVRAPSTTHVVILRLAELGDLSALDHWIDELVSGADNLVSSKWFRLDASGISPYFGFADDRN